MTQFHVFLPPPSLPPLPLPAPIPSPLLTFHILTAPPRDNVPGEDPHSHSQSLTGIEHRLDRVHPTWIASQSQSQDRKGTERIWNSVLGKRQAGLGRDDGSGGTGSRDSNGGGSRGAAGLMLPPAPPANSGNFAPRSPPSPPRQSKRLAPGRLPAPNPTPDIDPHPTFHTLPHPTPSPNYPSSFDSSLNTTCTFPSQLPPSGAEASMFHIPIWTIPLNKLVTLQAALEGSGGGDHRGDGREKFSVIVCVTSVDPPIERQRKPLPSVGPRAWKPRGEGTSLWIGKWTVIAPPIGREGEAGCGVKLWDDCARDWGDEKVRRGDVVLLENVEFKPASNKETAHLVLTPSNSPRITVLYRSLPRYTTGAKSDYIYRAPNAAAPWAAGKEDKRMMVHEDRQLRPDLRLGRSDMGVRKVAEVVRWFAMWVGGEAPSL
ncbi:hypothetical protein IAT38_002144 [Cryptococcus sp. DSM 104549]